MTASKKRQNCIEPDLAGSSRLKAEPDRHLFAQKASAWTVGLHPFAVDHELRNRALADVPDKLLGGARRRLDINFGIGDLMLLEESFGLAAIPAPRCGVELHIHPSMIPMLEKNSQARWRSFSDSKKGFVYAKRSGLCRERPRKKTTSLMVSLLLVRWNIQKDGADRSNRNRVDAVLWVE